MRFDINLATQAYEDAREFYKRWGAGLALALLVTVALVTLIGFNISATRSITSQIQDLKKQITNLEDQKRENETILNRSENRDTRERSQFLNGLIARKTFSWTQVFADLEKLMPPRVHVVSIRPELNEQSQLAIHMTIAGDSRDKAVDLVRNLEKSPRFELPQVVSEKSEAGPQQPGGDTVEFDVTAIYVPSPGRRAD